MKTNDTLIPMMLLQNLGPVCKGYFEAKFGSIYIGER